MTAETTLEQIALGTLVRIALLQSNEAATHLGQNGLFLT
jgi:hypothetical protein